MSTVLPILQNVHLMVAHKLSSKAKQKQNKIRTSRNRFSGNFRLTSRAITLLLLTLLIMQTAKVNNPAELVTTLRTASAYRWQQQRRQWRHASSSSRALLWAAGEILWHVPVPGCWTPGEGALPPGPPPAWDNCIVLKSSRSKEIPSKGSEMNSCTKLQQKTCLQTFNLKSESSYNTVVQ